MFAGRRPLRALRFLARAPAALFDLNLGWLLGHRFLLLTHRGRRSGRLYRTFVEVIRYEPETGECTVVSGWGERSDWFRNITAAPAVRVQIARTTFRPTHRLLSAEEAELRWQAFRRDHPIEWVLALRLFRALFHVDVRSLPLVVFRPAAE